MARQGFRVFDSDLHVLEPADLWERYIDPKFKDRAPRGHVESALGVRVQRGGRVYPTYGKFKETIVKPQWKKMEETYRDSIARGFDSVSQLAAMDREGVDVAMLFPSRGLYVIADESMDSDLAVAIARASNDWMGDFCRTDPKRMLGCALLPIHDIAASVQEARRCVKEYGFRGAFLRPNPPKAGLYFHDSRFDPLWAELQELDIPVLFHEASFPELPYVGRDRFSGEDLDLVHLCSHTMESMLAMASLVMRGVFERFPRLRAAFLEANCSWLPHWLWRMKEHMHTWGGPTAPKTSPEEVFFRQCFLSFEPDETPALAMLDQIDAANLVFSTDYPHQDSRYPEATNTFLRLPISDDHKRKILWDNCARLYGL